MQPLPTAQLERFARELGFDRVGFARAEALPPEHLTEWLAAGYAADMDWVAERAADRLDPRRLLPGARTVVVFATNFYAEGAQQGPERPVARYARGRDYHATLTDRVKAFRRRLVAAFPGVDTYARVDHGPLMEKVWAAKAGLGYVGKHSLLITPDFGSWVMLAVMLLDAEVDAYADGPTPDRCGTCRRCLMACPTDAIVPGKRVDAGRCLSYQTIENRHADVPEALRASFASLSFGCDICQDVCPLNRHPVVATHARLAPRAVAGLGARELAALTPEAYQQLVPGTALARAGYDGLRRNAAYTLGAARDVGARALLEKLCADPSELVRSAAQWALEQLTPQ